MCGSAERGRSPPGKSVIALLGVHYATADQKELCHDQEPIHECLSQCGEPGREHRTRPRDKRDQAPVQTTTSMVNAWVDAWTPKPKAKAKPARKRKRS